MLRRFPTLYFAVALLLGASTVLCTEGDAIVPESELRAPATLLKEEPSFVEESMIGVHHNAAAQAAKTATAPGLALPLAPCLLSAIRRARAVGGGD